VIHRITVAYFNQQPSLPNGLSMAHGAHVNNVGQITLGGSVDFAFFQPTYCRPHTGLNISIFETFATALTR